MAQAGKDFLYDPFDDGSSKLVGEQHLRGMHSFMTEFAQQLREIEEALSEALSDVWDPDIDPVTVHLEPYEQTCLKELVNTENKLFNKIILVFASLCKECRLLVHSAEERIYSPLLLFGQELREEPTEGDAQVFIGNMLPFFMELRDFITRVYAVVQNIMRQLASLYHKGQRLYKELFKEIHMNTLFYYLAELLSVLITIDEIISQNQFFKASWSMYKRMTKSITMEPERYATDEASMLQFEKLLLSLEGQLLDGLVYQNCIEQEFDFPGLVEVRQNAVFNEEFMTNIKSYYARMTSKGGDLNENYQRHHIVGLCALYVFFFTLFKQPLDKKFFKQVWDMYQTIPVVHLCGNTVWFPTEFLKRKVPYMVKTAVGNPDIREFLLKYVKELDNSFVPETSAKYMQLCVWMTRMESSMANRADVRNMLNSRMSLLIAGLKMAHEIGDMFRNYVYLHAFMKVPIKPVRIRRLCQCIEMLKAIQATFHRRTPIIGESIAFMMQQMSFFLQRAFYPIKLQLEGTNKYSDQRLDVLAAANLCMQMLNGSATEDRLLLLRLALHVLAKISIKDEQIIDIKDQIRRLDVVSHLQRYVERACNCSFLYWSRVLIPAYLEDIYHNPEEAQKLHYMFHALRDIVPHFKRSVHVDPAVFLDAYKKQIDGYVSEKLLKPLCLAIEQDLRFHIHSHLEVSERDPFKQGVRDLAALVSIKPLRFVDRTLNIKAHIEHYLDTSFYNLTTVALYDWKTYAEMRNLAKDKYGLNLHEVHLPGQILDQGVDVLEIMRNIHIFVARYNYNLNNQIFIEKNSDSKFINTVNIQHIANSLRSHGAGIMNTTVNFTYQFLKQKFVIFSQFLYDDYIKSHLFKDLRFFKENREKLNGQLPYERGEKLTREIRKLGVSNGLTYLDQFRRLITEIGNAMGYIRMIRSGGLYFTSNAIKFVPDLKNIPNFESNASKAALSAETIQAAKNLDRTLEVLSKNFAEGTDYFKKLVAVFAPEFRHENNMHLRNFYIIVPPLTISYVEHMLVSKDSLKNKKGAVQENCFTDDGFAIGVAYILKLLDQNHEFDSLHWFEAVKERFDGERNRLMAELNSKKSAKKKEDEVQTVTLTMKKLANYQLEFELLRYSFSGARIFFKD